MRAFEDGYLAVCCYSEYVHVGGWVLGGLEETCTETCLNVKQTCYRSSNVKSDELLPGKKEMNFTIINAGLVAETGSYVECKNFHTHCRGTKWSPSFNKAKDECVMCGGGGGTLMLIFFTFYPHSLPAAAFSFATATALHLCCP